VDAVELSLKETDKELFYGIWKCFIRRVEFVVGCGQL
jgi:hypothetical protein